MSSISFDRAVDFYDKTRGLPPEQAERVSDVLVRELADRGRALEIGVGTGRIALPLHARGVDLTGIDISLPMLERLVTNSSGRPPFALLVADATQLPFRDDAYDAAIASHVFHLVPGWRAAADELLRVVAPGGVLLVDLGRHGGGPWHDVMVKVLGAHGIVRPRVGVTEPEEFTAHLGERAVLRELPVVTIPIRASLGELITMLEKQVTSWTWGFTKEQMRAGAEAMRDWARANGVALDEPRDMPYDLQFRAYDVIG